MAGVGVAVIGAVIAIVVATRGGSSGGTARATDRPHSRDELAERTFTALVAGDVSALEQLADPAAQMQRTSTCPPSTAEETRGVVVAELKKHVEEFQRGAGNKGESAKVSVKAFREGPPPQRLLKGADALEGCTFTVDLLIHTLTFDLQIDDQRPLEARLMAMQVADDWYLLGIGYLEGLVNDSGG